MPSGSRCPVVRRKLRDLVVGQPAFVARRLARPAINTRENAEVIYGVGQRLKSGPSPTPIRSTPGDA